MKKKSWIEKQQNKIIARQKEQNLILENIMFGKQDESLVAPLGILNHVSIEDISRNKMIAHKQQDQHNVIEGFIAYKRDENLDIPKDFGFLKQVDKNNIDDKISNTIFGLHKMLDEPISYDSDIMAYINKIKPATKEEFDDWWKKAMKSLSKQPIEPRQHILNAWILIAYPDDVFLSIFKSKNKDNIVYLGGSEVFHHIHKRLYELDKKLYIELFGMEAGKEFEETKITPMEIDMKPYNSLTTKILNNLVDEMNSSIQNTKANTGDLKPGEPYGCSEIGKCDICGKYAPINRKYYYYPIKCECHSPQHFEIVLYCSDCIPIEPERTTIIYHDMNGEHVVNNITVPTSIFIKI